MKPALPLPTGRLRPATAGDLNNLSVLLHDPAVRRYLCDDAVLPRVAIAGMLAESDALDTRGLGLWAIEDRTGGFAGIAGLQPVSAMLATAAPTLAGEVEPVIALAPAFWGQGLASAALGVLVAHACDTLRLRQLVAAVDAPNQRSHTLMRRGGFSALAENPKPSNDWMLYRLPLEGAGAARVTASSGRESDTGRAVPGTSGPF